MTDFDSPADLLSHTTHRPWPVPDHRWVLAQEWSHLLFAHWPVDYYAVRALVPPELPLDAYDGRAWIAITSFALTLRPRGLPLPLVRNAPELNVRTYVTIDGKPGVYFFSLDVRSLSAVLGARLFYRLPYFPARMSMQGDAATIHYLSERIASRRAARFQASYRPVSEPIPARRGSLEYFLAERYCLYTARPGGVFRTEIHHLPWPLQRADVEIRENSVAAAARLELPKEEPLAHFSRHLAVLTWAPRRVEARVRITVPQPSHAAV